MPTFITRRTALGITAAAALASLTACASDIRPLSNPSTADAQRSYKGELKFNNYESRGTYARHLRSRNQLEEGGESAQACPSCRDESQNDGGHVRRHRLLGSIFQLPDALR